MRNSSRWYDDYGADPVDGTTISDPRPNSPSPPIVVDHRPLPLRPGTGNTPGASNGPPSAVLQPSPSLPVADVKLSQQSGIAPYETLFHDFNLQAEPVYNFWEQSEENHDGFPQGNRDINDMPRYIQLWWNTSPDIKDPDKYRKDRLKGQDPDARQTFTKLSPFGFGSYETVSTAKNGVLILPQHMQPDNFSSNANNLANGHVFSGIIEATSEIKQDFIFPAPQKTDLIGEDEHLANPKNAGLSVPAVNSALWNYHSSIYGWSKVFSNKQYISPGAKLQQQHLVNGQFGMVAPSLNNGPGIKSVNPSSPSISVPGRTALVNGKGWFPKIFDALAQAKPPAQQPVPVQAVKVKLLHTHLGKLYDNEHVNSMTQPHHAENAIALVPFVGNLVAYAAAGVQHYRRDVAIPGNPVAKDLVKPLEYIGYIIEKYEQVDGAFKKVDVFYIPGREFDSINDGEIKYGVSYRYRIRGVLRWSRPREVGILGTDPTVAPSNVNVSMTPYDVSYFGSEWGSSWAYAHVLDYQKPDPPDELVVRPISNHKDELGASQPAVEITFKLPNNPQRDINKMTLWRKLVDANNNEVTDWIQIQEVNEEDRQGTRKLYLTELQHEQDDLTGTKVRAIETEQVETFAEWAPLNARFLDTNVVYWGERDSCKYVYAALCHTRHGETSPLSDQLACRLNPHWQKDGEFPVEFVSCAGVDIQFDTGPFRVYPEIRDRSEVIFNTKFDHETGAWVPGSVGFTGQTRLADKMLNGNKYIARVESLDTGQHVDIPVEVVINNQPEQYQEAPDLPIFSSVVQDSNED